MIFGKDSHVPRGDVRIENVPNATIVHPTDAVIRVTRACVCESDLWRYNELEPTPGGRPMGREAIGVVEAMGANVRIIGRLYPATLLAQLVTLVLEGLRSK